MRTSDLVNGKSLIFRIFSDTSNAPSRRLFGFKPFTVVRNKLTQVVDFHDGFGYFGIMPSRQVFELDAVSASGVG